MMSPLDGGLLITGRYPACECGTVLSTVDIQHISIPTVPIRQVWLMHQVPAEEHGVCCG